MCKETSRLGPIDAPSARANTYWRHVMTNHVHTHFLFFLKHRGLRINQVTSEQMERQLSCNGPTDIVTKSLRSYSIIIDILVSHDPQNLHDKIIIPYWKSFFWLSHGTCLSKQIHRNATPLHPLHCYDSKEWTPTIHQNWIKPTCWWTQASKHHLNKLKTPSR